MEDLGVEKLNETVVVLIVDANIGSSRCSGLDVGCGGGATTITVDKGGENGRMKARFIATGNMWNEMMMMLMPLFGVSV